MGEKPVDEMMREFGNALEAPEWSEHPFTTPPPLSAATVAIVTSAALHRMDDDRFTAADTSYRTIETSDRDLVLGHWSQNFDRAAFALDLNVVFPIDRLSELAARGTIGAVAPRHFAFAGNQMSLDGVRYDSGPRCAADLRHDGVDVVLLTPV